MKKATIKKLSLALIFVLILLLAISLSIEDSQECVFLNCMEHVIACGSDTECNGWLTCMGECGDDKMLCPTQCGAFFQSDVINSLSQCALNSGCISIEFPDLPACNLPEAEPVAVDNIDGFWWVSAIKGSDYVLFDDCQRFILQENETGIDVENSTLVTYKDETRVAINNGLFTRTDEGYLKLVYENWAGYSEQYHPYYVTPNTMVMHVCSVDSEKECHDYGILLLTREPLSSMDSGEMAEMETALENVFQNTLEDFRMIRTSDCPNSAETN